METKLELDCGANWSGGGAMTKSTDMTIGELTEKRNALAARINSGEVDEYDPEYDPIMTQLEQIDWQIVHTKAQTLSDLRLKFERMSELVCPMGFVEADTTIETGYIKSLFDDIVRFSL